MKTACAIVILACVGCSSIEQSAQTVTTQAGATNRTTSVKVRTLFDAKQVVAALKASNGATHNLGASGVDQQSTSEFAQKIVEGAVKGAIEAAK